MLGGCQVVRNKYDRPWPKGKKSLPSRRSPAVSSPSATVGLASANQKCRGQGLDRREPESTS